MDTNTVLPLVRRCIGELNEQFAPENRLDTSETTVLVGVGGQLDSLSLINLLVLLEETVRADLGVDVTLVDEDLMTREDGPYHTVGRLAEWIAGQC